MDTTDQKELIEAFKGYRDLLAPIEKNLSDFSATYGMVRENVDKLNEAFGGETKEMLGDIYKTLSVQAEKASDLSSRIDQFLKTSQKYTSEVARMLDIFSSLEERIRKVTEIETKAEEQIGRLDALLAEKQRSYNLKELEKTLDSYNSNVQRVSEFINKDVADTLSGSAQKLAAISGGIEEILSRQRTGDATLERLIETYSSSGELLKRISEKQDVNEAYIFDIIDAWAESRNIKKGK